MNNLEYVYIVGKIATEMGFMKVEFWLSPGSISYIQKVGSRRILIHLVDGLIIEAKKSAEELLSEIDRVKQVNKYIIQKN